MKLRRVRESCLIVSTFRELIGSQNSYVESGVVSKLLRETSEDESKENCNFGIQAGKKLVCGAFQLEARLASASGPLDSDAVNDEN